MGCVNSAERDDKYGSAASPEGVNISVGEPKTDEEKREDSGFNKWSAAENAEEQTFIGNEQDDDAINKLLDAEFPHQPERQQSDFSSIAFWANKPSHISEPEPAGL